MLKFENCWKCEEMNKTRVLNNKLPIDICIRVCEYDKCDKCRKKILEIEDFDENPKLSKLSKVQKILIHLLYRNHDIETNMTRRKYKNIIRRSNNPLRKIMKQFVKISETIQTANVLCFTVHVTVCYCILSLAIYLIQKRLQNVSPIIRLRLLL